MQVFLESHNLFLTLILKTAVSLKPAPTWVTAHRTGDLEHIVQPISSSTGWTVSFPSFLAGLNLLIQAAWLVSASSRQLVWSWSLLCNFVWESFFAAGLSWVWRSSLFMFIPGKEGPSESRQFQGIPELFWVVYLPAQIASLQDGLFQSWRQLLHNTNN